jgi:hypothetical protein
METNNFNNNDVIIDLQKCDNINIITDTKTLYGTIYYKIKNILHINNYKIAIC